MSSRIRNCIKTYSSYINLYIYKYTVSILHFDQSLSKSVFPLKPATSVIASREVVRLADEEQPGSAVNPVQFICLLHQGQFTYEKRRAYIFISIYKCQLDEAHTHTLTQMEQNKSPYMLNTIKVLFIQLQIIILCVFALPYMHTVESFIDVILHSRDNSCAPHCIGSARSFLHFRCMLSVPHSPTHPPRLSLLHSLN